MIRNQAILQDCEAASNLLHVLHSLLLQYFQHDSMIARHEVMSSAALCFCMLCVAKCFGRDYIERNVYGQRQLADIGRCASHLVQGWGQEAQPETQVTTQGPG